MLCYISRLLYIQSKCNLAITITARYCTRTFGNHRPGKLTLQISTLLTFYDSASVRVLYSSIYSTLQQSPFWDCIYGSQALLSFNNIRFSFHVLIYIVHYGNRPSEITHTDLRYLSFNNIRFSFRVLIYIVHYSNRPSEITHTDLRHFSFNNTRFSFRVLIYIVHYGNRPCEITHTDLGYFSHLTIYAFLSVYLSI